MWWDDNTVSEQPLITLDAQCSTVAAAGLYDAWGGELCAPAWFMLTLQCHINYSGTAQPGRTETLSKARPIIIPQSVCTELVTLLKLFMRSVFFHFFFSFFLSCHIFRTFSLFLQIVWNVSLHFTLHSRSLFRSISLVFVLVSNTITTWLIFPLLVVTSCLCFLVHSRT